MKKTGRSFYTPACPKRFSCSLADWYGVMDTENLHSGQKFKELPDTYTIFIIEKDFYGKDELVYPIERINLATGEFFDAGEYILYTNRIIWKSNYFTSNVMP